MGTSIIITKQVLFYVTRVFAKCSSWLPALMRTHNAVSQLKLHAYAYYDRNIKELHTVLCVVHMHMSMQNYKHGQRTQPMTDYF